MNAYNSFFLKCFGFMLLVKAWDIVIRVPEHMNSYVAYGLSAVWIIASLFIFANKKLKKASLGILICFVLLYLGSELKYYNQHFYLIASICFVLFAHEGTTPCV